MDKRFARKLRAVRLRGARGWAVLATTTLLILLIIYLVVFSPLMVLQDVRVTGAPKDVAQEAVANAEAPMGRSLARVDTDAIAERIASDSRIAQVDVGRDWPSELTVELVMRQPVVVLVQPRTDPVLVSADGVAYEEVTTAPRSLPRATAPPGEVDPAALRGLVAAYESIGDEWADDISALRLTSDGDIRFRIGSVTVLWGQARGTEAKAVALEALLAQDPIDPNGEAPVSVDLTAPATPVVTGLPTLP